MNRKGIMRKPEQRTAMTLWAGVHSAGKPVAAPTKTGAGAESLPSLRLSFDGHGWAKSLTRSGHLDDDPTTNDTPYKSKSRRQSKGI